MIADSLFIAFGFKPDQTSIAKADSAIDSLGAKVKSVAATAALALAPAALASFVGGLVNEATDAADASAKAARAANVSTEALQELQFAARLSGVEIEQLNAALPKLSRRISEAAKGEGEAAKAFKELNVNARELNRLEPDKQFEAIAQALSEVENDSDRARLSMKLLEEVGPRFATMFAGGAQGIKDMREQARQLGIIISDEDAQRAEKFNDSVDVLRMTTRGLARRFALDLLPVLQQILDLFLEFQADGLSDSQSLIKALSITVRDFLITLRDWLRTTMEFIRAIGGLNNALKLMAIIIASLAGARGIQALLGVTRAATVANIKLTASAVAAAAPYLLLAAAVGLVLLALDDVRGWVEGEDSLIGDVFGEYDAEALKNMRGALLGIMAVLAILLGGTLGLVALLLAAGIALFVYWDDLGTWFEGFFIKLISGFDSAVAKIKKFFSDTIDDIEQAFDDFFKWLIEQWNAAVQKAKQAVDKITGPINEMKEAFDAFSGDIQARLGLNDGAPRMAQQASAGARTNVNTNVKAQVSVDARGMSEEEASRAVSQGITNAPVWSDTRDAYQDAPD